MFTEHYFIQYTMMTSCLITGMIDFRVLAGWMPDGRWGHSEGQKMIWEKASVSQNLLVGLFEFRSSHIITSVGGASSIITSEQLYFEFPVVMKAHLKINRDLILWTCEWSLIKGLRALFHSCWMGLPEIRVFQKSFEELRLWGRNIQKLVGENSLWVGVRFRTVLQNMQQLY